jgi:hypothetical protein
MARVQFKIFFSFHTIHIGSEAHPASYPMAARGSFPRVKVAGA